MKLTYAGKNVTGRILNYAKFSENTEKQLCEIKS